MLGLLMSNIILQTHKLTKEFKGFTAVSQVDLSVVSGSIHALIGPNGAGKTTCFNLLTKFLEPTSGTILFNGIDITRERPAQIARRGIIRSFQISAVFPHLTVLENVRVALQRKRGSSFDFWRSEQVLEQLNDTASELIAAVNLTEFEGTVAVELPYGRKRALEIATTLALDPEMMLLDEPTGPCNSSTRRSVPYPWAALLNVLASCIRARSRRVMVGMFCCGWVGQVMLAGRASRTTVWPLMRAVPLRRAASET